MEPTDLMRFIRDIRENPGIQQRLAGVEDVEGLTRRLVEIGREQGHEFEPAAIYAELMTQRRANGESRELSDDELSGVSGGFWGGLIGKLFGKR